MSTATKHPARYSDALLSVFLRELMPLVEEKEMEDLEDHHVVVLDPMAGTGRVHELFDLDNRFASVGVEIEPEWATMHPNTLVGNALDLKFFKDVFDAIVVSPTYGNRMADHHNAQDGSVRRSYTHDLGRKLHKNNSGAMQWGDEYRKFHVLAWTEACRVLRPGGRFLLNVKDHIRGGQRQYVSGWHVSTLCRLGLDLLHQIEVPSPGMRKGANNEARVGYEMVYVFEQPKETSL